MTAQQNQPDWVRLFHIACDLIRQVNSETLIIDHWTFGGGTALMLQIDHRESHDVDFFLQDPQWLSFLDPEKQDFKFDIWPSDYRGDGTTFLKFAFDNIGQIDFIVGQPKTGEPTIERMIEGERTLLETVPEIITKKIVHRGSSIKPRDVFDIAAASEQYGGPIISALHPYKSKVAETMKTLEVLNPEFVNNAIAELQIREKFRPLTRKALDRAKEILRAA